MSGGRYLQTIPTWLIPYSGLLASVAQTTDEFYRKPSKELIAGFGERAMTRLPGLSKMVPARQDIFGDPAKRRGGPVARGLLPFAITKQDKDIVPRELLRLSEEGAVISFPGDRLSDTIKMEPDEYRDFLYDQGQDIKKTLGKLYRLPGYHRLPLEMRVKMTRKAAEESRAKFRKRARVEYLLKAQGLPTRSTQLLPNPAKLD